MCRICRNVVMPRYSCTFDARTARADPVVGTAFRCGLAPRVRAAAGTCVYSQPTLVSTRQQLGNGPKGEEAGNLAVTRATRASKPQLSQVGSHESTHCGQPEPPMRVAGRPRRPDAAVKRRADCVVRVVVSVVMSLCRNVVTCRNVS